jgi:hypothetical protein
MNIFRAYDHLHEAAELRLLALSQSSMCTMHSILVYWHSEFVKPSSKLSHACNICFCYVDVL